VVIESEVVKSKVSGNHVICYSYAIVIYRYKYIWNSLTGEELYDLLKDPLEPRNIATENRDFKYF